MREGKRLFKPAMIPTKFKKTLLAILPFLVILIAATGLRLYRIGSHSLWLDEIAGIYGFDVVNPFFYLFIQRMWITAVGSGETMIRLPSAIYSLLSLPIIFILGRRLFSARAGMLAAIILTVSPYSINYAQEGRMYSLVWLLIIISFYFFYRFYKEGSQRFLIGCLLANAGAVYVSYSSLILVITETIIILLFPKRQRWKLWLWGQLAFLALLLPLLPSLLQTATSREGIGWITLTSHYRSLFQGIFFYLGGDLTGRGKIWIQLPYLVLIVLGYFQLEKGKFRINLAREDLFLIVWFTAPILIGLAINIFFPFLSPLTIRYIGFIQFPFYLAVARGISRIRSRVGEGIIIFILLLISSHHLIAYYRGNNCVRRENWRGVIHRLEDDANPEDFLLVLQGAGLPYRHYSTDKIENLRFAWQPDSIADFSIPPDHNHIFILYRTWQHRLRFQSLPGYSLLEHFRDGPIGYYKFELKHLYYN